MIFHVPSLETRVLDPTTHLYQFDVMLLEDSIYAHEWPLKTNKPSFCLMLKLSHALDGLFCALSRLHSRRKYKCAFCWMKDHWTWLLSDIVAWDSFWHWNPLFIFRYRCCDDHSPWFCKYIFPQLQTCSADCAEGSFSSNIPSNF